ncbi:MULTISPECIES: ATP phosphoribosyltransferase regulatory subunit [Halomonadaceae]|jgi:ATP phosphoribosyltransferase regulatory subunit|uniref:ATP phosphoribosyltransferase regulatory subunit n=1 Tax=Vreelandella aquamarina TaxID=77097 RepID=A0A0D7UYH4_9GAMM|nr:MULTISPECIES: ATP phosphoribosyltransferase regulatory subunit [Halomonas]MEC9020056.1 ATP phosphoribosyltransferase regulatory subunit [Pseudomonadota bacterium]HAO00249.1 ATP phosphoribosyltransferase regulatory subunit [Halomonas sp.]KJD19665.1 ATP phosphoribosyltransferase [Halomonas meridiana]MCC4288009.1 ATP phosphoribosyltransferase regulatory subunit [Halomonas meridiana]MCC4291031.1 ATP phosphoribosyltransferase regulatory subunit [Halomonas axialensis]|tara:strand:- start:2236 stop:3429 length:1194 start_codon:yes stop_codon:yes gene_type:complete
MTIADRWLLPDGMDEVLPPQASRMEELRRALLDLYHCWGYDQVMPPPVEFLDSLLTGTGTDLDLQTFKLTDQLTGRMMGASADVTPQVARMDAHSLKRQGPVRLCYCTNVLRAKADQHQGGRSPVQVGVELFGHAGLEADSEIIHLALASLHAAGADEIHLALGHIGIYRSLVEAAALSDEQERALFEALALKSPGQLAEQVNDSVSDPVLADMLMALGELHGDASVLAQARERFAGAPAPVTAALDQLEALYKGVLARFDVSLYFDLAELRGYQYHTGMMFAAYVPGYGHALAKGGRYDDTGRAFGRARPATGFSMDLKQLASLALASPSRGAIWAPAQEEESLNAAIVALREQGERVIQALPGQRTGPAEHSCDRRLEFIDGRWQTTTLTQETSA